jgi:hypothetical protein
MQSSCLSLPSAGITAVHRHAQCNDLLFLNGNHWILSVEWMTWRATGKSDVLEKKGQRSFKMRANKLEMKISWAPMAPTYNPIYLGNWDWEDLGSRPVPANSSEASISKITRAKWTGGVAQVIEQSPEFKAQSHPTPPPRKWESLCK